MDILSPACVFSGCISQTEMGHLACMGNIGHGANGLLDWHGRIGKVEIQQVDCFDTEPAEPSVDGF